jgi:hypothetical protein
MGRQTRIRPTRTFLRAAQPLYHCAHASSPAHSLSRGARIPAVDSVLNRSIIQSRASGPGYQLPPLQRLPREWRAPLRTRRRGGVKPMSIPARP